MPNIQERKIDSDSFLKLKDDPAIVNWAVCSNQDLYLSTLKIYEQFIKSRHDWQIYRLENIDIPTECVLLLVKRGKLSEDYFYTPKNCTLLSQYTLGDVIKGNNTINYTVCQTEMAYSEALSVMKRSIKYAQNSSEIKLIRVLPPPNTQEVYMAILIIGELNQKFFESME